MKTVRKLIDLLVEIETGMVRRKASRMATHAAVRMALNGCGYRYNY
jgi:hypothetical protein